MSSESDPLDRVTAAVEHARMLMYRGTTGSSIDSELHRFAALASTTEPLDDAYAAAIEVLASLPADAFDTAVEGARTRLLKHAG